MKQTLYRWAAATVLSTTAFADTSGTPVLQANTTLNLDTGQIVALLSKEPETAGPDIVWNGSTITPAGNATAVNIGALGSLDSLVQATLAFFPGYSKSAIPAAQIVVNDVFAVHTNGGHYSKVLVTAKSGTTLTLKFTTYGATGGTAGGPAVTEILNNSSHIARGFSNYGIAPSSLFVVKGSGLADPGQPVLQSSAPPGLPLTLNGASITVVVNGVTTHPPLYYTTPTQLAAVLPAATPVGTGTLTVTYKGATSVAAAIQVVPTALGISTYNGSGIATDAITGSLLTYDNSGSPGQIIVLWATGLGADPADSDTTITASPHSVNTPMQIYIGGEPANILYQGASAYPGVNQINLTIPQSVPTGCFIPLVAVTGKIISNVVTFPISKGGGACIDAPSGLTGAQIQQRSGMDKLRGGFVGLIQTNSTDRRGVPGLANTATAAFEEYSGLEAAARGGSVSPGGCIVTQAVAGAIPSIKGLDVGTISLTGPGGLSVTLGSQFGIKGAFFATLSDTAIPASGGSFTFKGTGGADVGPFTTTLDITSPLKWTNPGAAATIDRGAGLPVTWTGGTPGSYVFILGSSVNPASPLSVTGYTCLAPAEAGKFTVPSYILTALPAGNGGTILQNDIYKTLSATGLDAGQAIATISTSVNSTYN